MSSISNDSGLDDCGAAASQPLPVPVPPAATRLSWFLAEVDEGVINNGIRNGKRHYIVLHSMELMETDVSDKYMTRFVEFRMNNIVVEAKLILAADDRKVVDAALVAMNNEEREEEEEEVEVDVRQLLIQYNEENGEHGDRLVQRIITPQHVVWMSSNPEVRGTPLVKLAPGRIAHVLYAYEQRHFMEKVLMHLKASCFDYAFEELMDSPPEPLDEDSWLLLQYSPEPEMIVYQVVSFRDTVWRDTNMFKDVIAYLQPVGSELVQQAVVICWSHDKPMMMRKYDHLRRFSLELPIPLPDELDRQMQQSNSTAALFTRTNTSLFQRAEQRDTSGEHRRMRNSFEQLNLKAEDEADMIIGAFEVVDNINASLQNSIGDTEGQACSKSAN